MKFVVVDDDDGGGVGHIPPLPLPSLFTAKQLPVGTSDSEPGSAVNYPN